MHWPNYCDSSFLVLSQNKNDDYYQVTGTGCTLGWIIRIENYIVLMALSIWAFLSLLFYSSKF